MLERLTCGTFWLVTIPNMHSWYFPNTYWYKLNGRFSRFRTGTHCYRLADPLQKTASWTKLGRQQNLGYITSTGLSQNWGIRLLFFSFAYTPQICSNRFSLWSTKLEPDPKATVLPPHLPVAVAAASTAVVSWPHCRHQKDPLMSIYRLVSSWRGEIPIAMFDYQRMTRCWNNQE